MALKWIIRPPVEPKELTWPSRKGVMVADTVERCREALAMFRDQPIVGVDVEAYGCDPRREHPKGKARALSIQFAGETGPSVFVPLWTVSGYERNGDFQINPTGREHLLDVFAEWLEDDRRTKVLHNGMFDRHVLANHQITMRGFLGDTLVMDYYVNNGEQLHGLKECMRREFGERDSVDYKDVFREFKKLKRPRLNKKTGEIETHGKQTFVPSLLDVIKTQEGVNKLVNYAVKDPIYTVRLYKHLYRRLEEMPWVKASPGQEALPYSEFYTRVARRYSDTLYKMEDTGCPINEKKLLGIRDRLETDIAALQREFMHACVNWGVKPSYMETFNMEAGAQVADLFYDVMKMRCEVFTKKGAKSTAKGALEAILAKRDRSRRAALHAEIVDIFLKYKSKTTLRKMFIRPLVKFAPQYGGRIHSSFKQTGTQTNRLSSALPNLENIPANKKDEEYALRSCFVAPEDFVVADIDLKQIEVRIMAHFTKDPVLLELLRNGWDQHLIAMCMLFEPVREFMGATYVNGVVTFRKDRPPNGEAAAEGEKKFGKSQWGEWRRRAKVLNFGVSYGMGPQGFSNQIGGGATVEDGKIAIGAYFRGFRGLERGIKYIKKKCHRFGYVKTLLKRYCMIPGIHSHDHALRSQAERQAFNYVVQGSAADMIMLGMIMCDMDPRLQKYGVKMINQIHDEIVFLVRKKYVDKAKPIIEEYVSHPYRHTKRLLGFPMKDLIIDTPADLGTGDNWMEAKK